MNAKLPLTLALGLALAAAAAHAAPVAPNPKSLLKNKKVLIVEATNWNGSTHKIPKENALAKLKLIQAQLAIPNANFVVADNVEAYTLATLAPYDIIVFNYVFNSQFAVGKAFEGAFKSWLASGNKGWMGYHTSGANDVNEWNWYRDSVTTMRYHVHSTAAQSGKMNITTDAAIKAHPILQGMDATFTGTDEWYDFDLPPRAPAPALWADCKVTYYLDEATLATKPSRPMNPHPMAWFREDAKKNRFYYSAFIHSDAGSASDFFHSTLLRALEYVAGYEDEVAIGSGGNDIRMHGNVAYVSASRELTVGAAGPHRLTVLSAKGKVLERFAGDGPRAYRPAAFAEPGVYFVRFSAKGKKVNQRILVY